MKHARFEIIGAAVLCVLLSPPGVAQLYGPPDHELAEQTSFATPLFIPDELNRMAASAIAEHPSIAAANSQRRAQLAEYEGARWLRFPSLNVEALAVTGGSNVAARDGTALNASIDQPIWSGGRISGEIDRARASYNSSVYNAEQTEVDLVLKTVAAYYDYLLGRRRVTTLTSSVQQHSELLGSISRRVEQEVSPLADLTLARSRAAQVELDLAEARRLEADASTRLEILTGRRGFLPVEQIIDRKNIAQLPVEDMAIEMATACSPSLAALENQIAMAEADKKIAKSRLLPQLSGQVSHNEVTGTRVGLVLRAQTGNGLSQFYSVDSAQARIDTAFANRAEAELALRQQIRSDFIILQSALRRLDAGGLASESAANIVASYRRQFLAGRRNWLDVMNAVREATQAELALADAEIGAGAAAARLALLTCQWQPMHSDYRREAVP